MAFGLPIKIEYRKGSTRTGTGKDGKKWSRLMHADYGHIKKTKGSDGEELDVYVGPHDGSTTVYAIDQRKAPEFKKHDEQKFMLGFLTADDAKKTYLKHYPSPKFFGGMTTMSLDDFKAKVLDEGKKGEKIAQRIEADLELLLELNLQKLAAGEELISAAPQVQATPGLSAALAAVPVMGPDSVPVTRTYPAGGAMTKSAEEWRPPNAEHRKAIRNGAIIGGATMGPALAAAMLDEIAPKGRLAKGAVAGLSVLSGAGTGASLGDASYHYKHRKKEASAADATKIAVSSEWVRRRVANARYDKVPAKRLSEFAERMHDQAEKHRRDILSQDVFDRLKSPPTLKRKQMVNRNAARSAANEVLIEQNLRGTVRQLDDELHTLRGRHLAEKFQHMGEVDSLEEKARRNARQGAALGVGGGLVGGFLIGRDAERHKKAQDEKTASEGRVQKIEDRIDDAGLALLAAPYVSAGLKKHLAHRKGALGVVGRAAGKAEDFFHNKVPNRAEIAGLALVAPGVIKPMAKGIDKGITKIAPKKPIEGAAGPGSLVGGNDDLARGFGDNSLAKKEASEVSVRIPRQAPVPTPQSLSGHKYAQLEALLHELDPEFEYLTEFEKQTKIAGLMGIAGRVSGLASRAATGVKNLGQSISHGVQTGVARVRAQGAYDFAKNRALGAGADAMDASSAGLQASQKHLQTALKPPPPKAIPAPAAAAAGMPARGPVQGPTAASAPKGAPAPAKPLLTTKNIAKGGLLGATGLALYGGYKGINAATGLLEREPYYAAAPSADFTQGM